MYKYDNKRRVALSNKTWKRLKHYKKLYHKRTMEECILEMLDEVEYGVERGC